MTENKKTPPFAEAAAKIKTANSIVFVLPNELGIGVIGSAAALASGLREIGKSVAVFARENAPSKEIAPWQDFGGRGKSPREFIISFDLTRSPIKELKYERDANRLDIILSPASQSIRREDIEFRYGALRYDLVITIGVLSPEDAAESIKAVPELFHQKPIVNIDHRPANAKYGEINLTPGSEEKPRSLPEMIYRLLGELGIKTIKPDTANALLASLFASTKNFALAGAEEFLTASELIGFGASAEMARRYVPAPNSLSEEQLAARALARTRLDKESNVLWSTLTKEDFVKTGTAKEKIERVLVKLADVAPHAEGRVLLIEDRDDGAISAFVAAHRFLEKRAGLSLKSSPASGWLELNEPFFTFISAEKRLGQLLSSPIALE